jgi:prepilin peptidase CpaA
MLQSVQLAALATVLVLAAWSDVRRARIPNVLTVAGLVAGLALSAAAGAGALVSSAQAVVIAFAFGFLLFVAQGLGGGDVKLLIALAALLGLQRFMAALVLTALAGGVLALLVALRRGVLLPVLLSSKDTLVSWVTPGGPETTPTTSPSGIAVPYGVAIAAGGLGAWFL